jgi:urease accessory protein
MTEARRAGAVRRGAGEGAAETVRLDWDGRFLRRRRLVTDSGTPVLVDLPETTSLDQGDALVLDGGGLVAVIAAPEPLLEVRGPVLARLAWHIGNRHAPCQIETDRLVIRFDPVLQTMLRQMGAEVREIVGPFAPEGGAYGHGRTLGHAHGAGEGHLPHHDHGEGDGAAHD